MSPHPLNFPSERRHSVVVAALPPCDRRDPEHAGALAATERAPFSGGVDNPGAVVKQGDDVLRPARPTTDTAHRLLRHVRARGFLGVPEPRGNAEGIERLSYIPGDVPIPPFPDWWKSDAALTSMANLLRRFHDATQNFASEGAQWSTELADPGPAEVICHNDVCPENVVYQRGEAVALLDFDYAAPGRRVYDLAQLAKMCCPLDAPEGAAQLGLGDLDPFVRLRLVADGYGLLSNRAALVDAIDDAVAVGDEFVERQVRGGEAGFLAMWDRRGGRPQLERRKQWLARNRQRLLETLG
jgi:Phosphotransferase enzyme family